MKVFSWKGDSVIIAAWRCPNRSLRNSKALILQRGLFAVTAPASASSTKKESATSAENHTQENRNRINVKAV
jgi:hypothetical protein